jgi:4'-phosphopantetheinyl transferase
LKYYHVRDAKMSLVSHLLKHLAITKLCSVPWSASTISKAANGKPCYIPPTSEPDGKTLEFNVSHQAGIVTLVAAMGKAVDLGTDVVCVNERNELARFEKEGLFKYIDMHADVFAESETQALKMDVDSLGLLECRHLDGYGRDAVARCQYPDQKVTWREKNGEVKSLDGKRIVEVKLRRFYALWCLREAYVKMTGEALLAEWLRELEFRAFATPKAADGIVDTDSLITGEVITDFEIYFKERKVNDVAMELRALGRDYMVASAARLKEGNMQDAIFDGFLKLDLERDIYAAAQM